MISVIVPIYNSQEYLPECLRSILCQTYTDFELILVNDGSTDESRQICELIAACDERVRLIDQANQGPAAARNTGLRESKGEWFCFVDSDDLVSTVYLEMLFSLTRLAPDIDVALVGYSQSGMQNRASKCNRPRILNGEKAMDAMLYQKGKADSSPWCKLYRKERFSDLWFNPAYRTYEDLEFLCRLYPQARQVAVWYKPFYLYRRQVSGSLISLSPYSTDIFDITEAVAKWYPQKEKALRSRRISASFNIIRIIASRRLDCPEMERRCWQMIKTDRCICLKDCRLRLKNRIGIYLSYLGLNCLKTFFRVRGL